MTDETGVHKRALFLRLFEGQLVKSECYDNEGPFHLRYERATPRASRKVRSRAKLPTQNARTVNAIPKTSPKKPPVSTAIWPLTSILARKRPIALQKKITAKMIAPILCIVLLATHCSVPKMLARLRLYRIGTYWPLNHLVGFVLRFSNA